MEGGRGVTDYIAATYRDLIGEWSASRFTTFTTLGARGASRESRRNSTENLGRKIRKIVL